MKAALDPGKRRAYALKYKLNGATKRAQLKHRYGLTVEQHASIMERQNGICPACGNAYGGKTLAIDHCHDTGKIRGVIHRQCNSMIGLAKESAAILEHAAKYLKQ